MRTDSPARWLAIISLALFATQARAASPPVSIEAVTVSPQSPGPGVLCTLDVRLKNAGTHTEVDPVFRTMGLGGIRGALSRREQGSWRRGREGITARRSKQR